MLLKERFREKYVRYLFFMYFIAAQFFFATLYTADNEAYREYRNDSHGVSAVERYTTDVWKFKIKKSEFTSEAEREWTESGLKIGEYVREEFMRRNNLDDEDLLKDLPINADLELLLDLWVVREADYARFELPRPEVFLGENSWNSLRDYYLASGTPPDLVQMVFYPYDYYLNDDAPPAPVSRDYLLEINTDTVVFIYQKLKNNSAIVLSDFPTMKFFSTPPGYWVLRLLSNRFMMIFYLILVVGISVSGFYSDHSLGISKNLVSRPKGRRSYLTASLRNNSLLLLGIFGLTLIPGLLVGLAKFGLKGISYPVRGFPYTYAHLGKYPLPRMPMLYLEKGGYFRIRQRNAELTKLEFMDTGIPLIKLVAMSLLVLLLLTLVLILISFIISNLSRKRSVVFPMAFVPLFMAVITIYRPEFANRTFPFNPLAPVDIVAVVTGHQDFTALSTIVALALWVLVLFAISDFIIRKKSFA